MAAPKGNKYWMERIIHGRKRIFETPQEMYNEAVEYFKFNETDTIVTKKHFCSQGQILEVDVHHTKPLSIAGFCLFAGIDRATFTHYENSKDDYFIVTNFIRETCYKQKFDGAGAGIFNANIIARDLGLVERTDVSSKDGSMTPKTVINLNKLSDQELAALEAMAGKLKDD